MALRGDPPRIPVGRVVPGPRVLGVARPGGDGEAASVRVRLRHHVDEAADYHPVQDLPLPAAALEDVVVVPPELEDPAAVLLLDEVVGADLAADDRVIALEVDQDVAYRVHGPAEAGGEL